MKIVPVILSGGSGSRLWPLSRGLYPKQFHDLSGIGNSLFQQTVARVCGEEFEAPLIICADVHNFLVLNQIEDLGLKEADIILEPQPRNTAPAITLAAQFALKKYGPCRVLILPSDHLIPDQKSFKDRIIDAHQAVKEQKLHATFGIRPTKAETGYGYIQLGDQLNGHPSCHYVEAFVEKPDFDTAQTYLASGNYLWNSGIFLFDAETLCAEIEEFEPAVFHACTKAMETAKEDLNFIRPDSDIFSLSPSISIDYAIMERTQSALVVPCSYDWSDVGSWSSIWQVSPKDDAGNAVLGDVITHDTAHSLLRSEGPLVAAIGLKDLIVVATQDAVLIADKAHDQDVKKIVEDLGKASRQEHISHVEIFRPWGSYIRTDRGPDFETRRLIINPGQRISYQSHDLRNEHWVVVKGELDLIIDQNAQRLLTGHSAYASAGVAHSLYNTGKEAVHVIEIRTGAHISEDDINRFHEKSI